MNEMTPPSESVAVIGLAGRFPGAANVAQLWRNVCAGVESIRRFSDEELAREGVPAAALASPNYVKANTVLEDVDLFDAAFFGYNPREAEVIDPQQRVFLETAWEALEDAGYDTDQYSGPIGIFAGVGMNSYLFQLYANRDVVAAVGYYQAMISNDKDYLATRVAYKLNLKGPAVVVQTACSTSLVAVQFACQSLLNYQCDVALAGGVSVNLPQRRGYLYQEGMILSPDGHCRAFDARAQGTVPGQGAGVVVLKRLSEAVADGDTILAVIRGAAVNNDGGHKIGYTAPSIDGQAEVIASALALAGVSADSIGYVEAHGTGTPLGDPIEIAALSLAYRASTDKTGYCALGSLKTNIGHLDAAAGVAGLIKTVLALHHRQIPPSLHFETPNPKIDFARSPFFVNTELRPWASPGQPRRAAVSSFGIGGTNAHAVLEEAPPPPPAGPGRPLQVLVLSARTEAALDAATQRLRDHLEAHPDLSLADAAYTLQVGRRVFDCRRVLLGRQAAEVIEAWQTRDPRRVLDAAEPPRERSVVFLFSGQGAQYPGMGRELYEAEPVFRSALDRCAERLQPELGLDLRELLNAPAADPDAVARLQQTALTQPALFATEYALAKLWMSWGVRPQAMMGHSLGEYVAACLAGVFTLEDGLRLVAARGRLMQQCPAGAMLSVPLAASELEAILAREGGTDLALAASNGPTLSVVSGPAEAVRAFEARLQARGLACRGLHTSHAFHSSMMDSILEPFAAVVRQVPLGAPRIPYISNLTGRWITAEQATDPGYWARHLRSAVRFSEGVRELLRQPDRTFIEVGPGQTLVTLTRQHLPRPNACPVIASLPHPQDTQPALMVLLAGLARFWLAGGQVDWRAFHSGEQRRRRPLPTYPFERQRYWVEPKAARPATLAEHAAVRQPEMADWFYVPSWRRSDLLSAGPALAARSWLMFLDQAGLGSALADRLRASGAKITTVHAGEAFARSGAAGYVIGPERREDYFALLRDLRAADRMPDGVVHLWGVDEVVAGGASTALGEEGGFRSLLFLAQALGDLAPDRPLRLKVIASGLHRVTGEEHVAPAKSLMLGPCRVLPQEYPCVRCTSVDVVVPPPNVPPAPELVELLMRELAADPQEPVVAYRGRHRWVQVVEPRRCEAAEGMPTTLRPKGVYVVTGGLGGIGLVLARYLARTVQARLVLVGRTPPPPRGEWAGWAATHGETDSWSPRLRALLGLEELGAEVLVCAADVADASQMAAVVAQAEAQFGPIQGVIHAAGIAGDGIMQVRTLEAAARVLRPKVAGTLVLEKVLSHRALDFLVLCSSVSSWLGGAGQADYAAANAFLDAYAWQRRGVTRVCAINWFAWREVGMAVNTVVPEAWKEQRDRSLRLGIAPEEGEEAFARALACGWTQVVISPPDFRAWWATSWQSRSLGADAAARTAPAPAAKALHARPSLASEYVAPGTRAERLIAEIWQHLLGVEKVGLHDNFFELGGHSLLATQLVARLRQAFPVEFTVASIFERPTVAALSQWAAPDERPPAPEAEALDDLAQVSARGRRRAERRRRRPTETLDESTT
jgi:acyl transferase domain-containing protein